MNEDTLSELATDALMLTLKVSMPFLLAGLVVGLLISVFQAATQIQEVTLSFIPKILVTGVVLAVGGPWMLSQLVGYTSELFHRIPTLVGP